MSLKKYRKDFPVLKRKEDKIIYLDNAASSLKPKQVIEAIDRYYKECPANVHRGIHRLSMDASVAYEEAHEKVAKFVNCKKEEAILTANSTDSINQIMYMLYNSDYFHSGDEIITTVYEHHANLVPWQFLAKKLGLKLKFVEIKDDYTFDMNDFLNKLSNKTKLVTIAHASNTIGTIAPIEEITKAAHDKGSLVAIDGSQSAPHMKIDFRKNNFDFFSFTAHKMLGPTGVGCLIAKEELLERLEPVRFGGDMVSKVTYEKAEWNSLPYKFEAGTPNISGAFGLSAAIDYLENIGMEDIQKSDKKLLKYALNKIAEVDGLKLYNPCATDKQVPILLFDIKGINPVAVSMLLDDIAGIATRSGMHCAQPIVSRLNSQGLTRVSFYFYNTKEEIDILMETLKKISKECK